VRTNDLFLPDVIPRAPANKLDAYSKWYVLAAYNALRRLYHIIAPGLIRFSIHQENDSIILHVCLNGSILSFLFQIGIELSP